MKRNAGFTHILLVLIIFIVGIFAAYVFINKKGESVTDQHMMEENEPDTKTYTNEKDNFSFEYPGNLVPLEQENGVVMFLPAEYYDSCKAGQGSTNIDDYVDCFQSVFSLNGFTLNPEESYDEYSKKVMEFATLETYTDDQGRIWETSLLLGQVYDFLAYTKIDGTTVRLSFQYGTHAPTEPEISAFFNEILNSFEL